MQKSRVRSRSESLSSAPEIQLTANGPKALRGTTGETASRYPGVISVMSELGIDISRHRFKPWTYSPATPFDYPQDSYLPVALKRLLAYLSLNRCN